MSVLDISGYLHNWEQDSIRTCIYLAIVFFIGSGITSIFVAKANEGKWNKYGNGKSKNEEEPLYVPLMFVAVVLVWAWTLYDPNGMDNV